MKKNIRQIKRELSNFSYDGDYSDCFDATLRGDVDEIKRLIADGMDVDTRYTKNGYTPLGFAAECGQVEVMKLFLDAGADPNTPFLHDWRAVEVAAYRGHFPAVKLLVENGADIVNTKNGVVELALKEGCDDMAEYLLAHGAQRRIEDLDKELVHACGWCKSLNYVKYLLEQGADINTADYTENAGGRTPLMSAIRTGTVEIAEYLISQGAEINARESHGYTPLMFAAMEDNSEKAIYLTNLLIEKGANVNAKNKEGNTALASASPEVSKILLDAGAKVDSEDNDRWTALNWACWGGKLDKVKVLVEAGADVNHRCSHGTPIDLAAEDDHTKVIAYLLEHGAEDTRRPARRSRKRGRNFSTPADEVLFREAVEDQDLETIAECLGNGVDPDTPINTEGDWTALMDAVWHSNLEMASMLIDAGADVNAKDNATAHTPLSMICGQNDDDVEFAKLLIDAGADVNFRDNTGGTPIINAADHGNSKILRLLIANRADVNAADKNGTTALLMAAKNGDLSNVRTLVEAGADIRAKNRRGDAIEYAKRFNHPKVLSYLQRVSQRHH